MQVAAVMGARRERPLRLAIIATHPIQYHAPWFQQLAQQAQLELRVFYAHMPTAEEQGIGFGVKFRWDIPLLEGYDWEVLPHASNHSPLRGFFAVRVQNIRAPLQVFAPDVVILTGWNAWPLVQALWACKRLNIPCGVRGESNALKPRPWWVRLAHRALLPRYDFFLAIGRANRNFYRQNGVAASRIFDCPYFIDNDRFRRQAETLIPERSAIRMAWKIPEHAVCYGYVGKLQLKKRITDLLQAFRLACQVNNNIHLLVVGTGELLAEAQAFAETWRLPVTFVGFLNQTEITRAYVAADCLVLPSDYGETWGLVVNEAMACGLAAIVSDRVGCGPDLIEEGVTGAVFPFGDADVLAGRLLDLAQDLRRLQAMGQRAQERVLQDYSVDKAVAGTVAAVQWLGGKGWDRA